MQSNRPQRTAAAIASLWLSCTALAAETPSLVSATEAVEPARATSFNLDRLPFIPVPEIDTSPHSGVTLGLIPVVLSYDERGHIDRILAPDVIHSQYFGWGARWRTFSYPSDDERWSVVAGGKQRVEREFNAVYDLGLSRGDHWSWSAHAMFDRSGTGRFFGLGNASPRTKETTFVDQQTRVEVTAGRNFTREMQLAYLVRADSIRIERGVLGFLPSIEDVYPRLQGVGEVHELQQRLTLTYDTRDSVAVPRRGERLAAFAGIATHSLGKPMYSYVGADGTWLWPIGPDVTLVAHAAARVMPSYADAPFWALSSIGGDRSVVAEAQPLRSYGAGRFVDRNSVSASVEARSWVRSFHLFGTDLKLVLAPFVDAGKVFRSGSPASHAHVGSGMGFRLVAIPFVVGYLDVGYGREGLAVFSGIDYPF